MKNLKTIIILARTPGVDQYLLELIKIIDPSPRPFSKGEGIVHGVFATPPDQGRRDIIINTVDVFEIASSITWCPRIDVVDRLCKSIFYK